jgi:hypothetical protein
MTRFRSPSCARWLIPSMPNMSPAAMGCNVVIPAGSPSTVNRSPTPLSTASGHPRPLDELTETTAPLGIFRAAS